MNAPDWRRGDRIGACVDRNMVTRDRRTPIMNWVMGVLRCFGNEHSEFPKQLKAYIEKGPHDSL